jgi:hypothetical protein
MLFYFIVAVVFIFGCSLGVGVGYKWRDRISRARRARYLAEKIGRESKTPTGVGT